MASKKKAEQELLDKINADPSLRAVHEKNERIAYELKHESEIEKRLPAEFVNQELQEVLTDSSIFDAQALYLRYTSIADISRITGIPIPTIRYYVYKDNDGWKKQRELLHREVKEEVRHNSLKAIREVTQVNLNLISRALKNFQKELDDNQLEPTMDQAYMLSDIFSKLHKAKIAEESDEVKETLGSITPEEVLDALTSDPYLRKAIAARESAVELPSDEFYEVVDEGDRNNDKDTSSLAHPNG